MAISLRGTVTYTFSNTYMHTSAHPDRNLALYKQLNNIVKRYKAGGPVFIGGDFNADIQSIDGNREDMIVGPHTFDRKNENAIKDSAMLANKSELMDFCGAMDHGILNTWFKKPAEQQITWRHPGTKPHNKPIKVPARLCLISLSHILKAS